MATSSLYKTFSLKTKKETNSFMQMFEELNKEGITIILVTHSAEVAGYAKRTIQIKDGIIIGGIFGKNDAEEGAQKP